MCAHPWNCAIQANDLIVCTHAVFTVCVYAFLNHQAQKREQILHPINLSINNMKLNKRIKWFIEDTEDFVILPDMLQRNGSWRLGNDEDTHKCCFGARIARALCKPRSDLNNDDLAYFSFKDGKKEMLKRLDIGEKELDMILYVCGTGRRWAFGGYAWLNKPAKVYQKLIRIERKPTDEEMDRLVNFCHLEIDPYTPTVLEIYESLTQPIKIEKSLDK